MLLPDSDVLRPDSVGKPSSSEGQMQTPLALFVRITLAAWVAALASIAGGDARAADDCLAKPDRASPPGTHWFYRLDRANHRRCWYLGDESASVHVARAPTPSNKSNVQPVAASDAEPSPSPAAPAIASGASQADLSSYWLGVPIPPNSEDRALPSTASAADAEAAPSDIPGMPDKKSPIAAMLAATDAAAAAAPAAPVRLEEMLALLAGALALAAIAVRVIFKFASASRPANRRWAHDARPAHDLPPALARAVAARRADVPPVAATIPPLVAVNMRRDEPVQAPLQPQASDDLEATLRQLLQDWERVAA
jgi:hypothetical protein